MIEIAKFTSCSSKKKKPRTLSILRSISIGWPKFFYGSPKLFCEEKYGGEFEDVTDRILIHFLLSYKRILKKFTYYDRATASITRGQFDGTSTSLMMVMIFCGTLVNATS